MKVTRDTPEQLVLDYVPWLWGGIIAVFTLIFVGVGLSMLFQGELAGLLFLFVGGGIGAVCLTVFVERLQVVLNRETGLLRLRRRTMLGYREEVFALDRLRGAVVQTSRDNDKNTDTHRPALLISPEGGDAPEARPVTQVYSSGQGAKRAAAAINGWMERGHMEGP